MNTNIRFLILWLVLVNLFALAVLNRFDVRGDTAYVWNDPTVTVQVQSWSPITLHARWDSLLYIDVAENGYRMEVGKPLANVVFFPLYPMLIRVAAPLVGGNSVLAGWIISMLALAGAVAVFYRLLREFHPSLNADNPILYLLIFPTAFFLNAVYTEGLFLLLSLLTFYYSLKGKFWMAGAFGLLAALTRVTGVLLFIPMFWEIWKRYGTRRIFSPSVVPAFLIPLGTALFMLYHRIVFGDALLFFKIESAWGRAFNFNKEHFLLLTRPAIINFTLDVAFVLFALFMVYRVFRLGWTSYGLYMLATIAVALSTGTLMSIGRYILVLFPMYIALATIKDRTTLRAYVLASTLLFALNITLFVNLYWAG